MDLKALIEAVKAEFLSKKTVVDGRERMGYSLFLATNTVVARQISTDKQRLEIVRQLLSSIKIPNYDLGEIEASSLREGLEAMIIHTILAHIESTCPELVAESRRRSDLH